MSFTLADYLCNQGAKVLERTLQDIVDKPIVFARDEAQYHIHVTQASWNALPLAIRLSLGRRFSLWEEFHQDLKREMLDLEGERVKLRPNSLVRIVALVRKHFDGIDGRLGAGTAREKLLIKPAPPMPPSAQPNVAIATPVTEPVTTSVPLAQPVSGPVESAPPLTKSTSLAQPLRPANTEADHSPPVGIDLGTTYSVIAHVDAQGRPATLLNADGERLTPSVVLFGSDGTIVGKQAVLGAALEPERTAIAVKRDMGAQFYRRKINGEHLPPEVISSFILGSLKADAERQLGPVKRAVITVPAYFDETRRRATVDAGRLAGLEVLDIINEPTAAAIAYGHQLGFLDRNSHLLGDRSLRVLVFDLGGGTFDVTIVEIRPHEFKALATDGDVNLGGRDWDERLVDIAATQFCKQFRDDPREHPVGAQELWLAAESAKRTLTERQKATLHVCHLGTRCKVDVTRQEFEEATAALLERTQMTTELVVRQAGLTFNDIDRVLLIGGSTRMPMVVRMLETLTGKPPDRSVSADEAVALGAALYAKTLVTPAPGESAESFSVTNINSHSLGVLGTDPENGKKFHKVLIPKNTPLPCTIRKSFKTFRHGQHSVMIKVLEGESDNPAFCVAIGVCMISNLPPNLPAGWPIEVSYTYASNGQLQVSAKLKDYNRHVETEFVRENRMPDDDLEVWAHFVEEELATSIE